MYKVDTYYKLQMYKLFIWAAARWLTDIDLFNLLASSAWSIKAYIKFIDPQYLHMLVNPQDIRYLDYIQVQYKTLKVTNIIYVHETILHTSDTYMVKINNPNQLIYNHITKDLYDGWIDSGIVGQLKYKGNYKIIHVKSNNKKISAKVFNNLMSADFNVVLKQVHELKGANLYTTNKYACCMGDNMAKLILFHNKYIGPNISRYNETPSTSKIIAINIANHIVINNLDVDKYTQLILSYSPFELIRVLWLNKLRCAHLFDMIEDHIVTHFNVSALDDPEFMLFALKNTNKPNIVELLLLKAVTMNELDSVIGLWSKHNVFMYKYKRGLKQKPNHFKYDIHTLPDLFEFIKQFGFTHGFCIKNTINVQCTAALFRSLDTKHKLILLSALYTSKESQLVVIRFIDEVRKLDYDQVLHAITIGIEFEQCTAHKSSTNIKKAISLLMDIPDPDINILNGKKWFMYRCWNILANMKFNLSAYNALIYADTPFDIVAKANNQLLYGINDSNKRKHSNMTKSTHTKSFNIRVWAYFKDKKAEYLSSCSINPSINMQIYIYENINNASLTIEHIKL
jgi:hypothetical protein